MLSVPVQTIPPHAVRRHTPTRTRDAQHQRLHCQHRGFFFPPPEDDKDAGGDSRINGKGQVRVSEGGDEGRAAGEGALTRPVARGRTCTRALRSPFKSQWDLPPPQASPVRWERGVREWIDATASLLLMRPPLYLRPVR